LCGVVGFFMSMMDKYCYMSLGSSMVLPQLFGCLFIFHWYLVGVQFITEVSNLVGC
jgi:hypothetical protein